MDKVSAIDISADEIVRFRPLPYPFQHYKVSEMGDVRGPRGKILAPVKMKNSPYLRVTLSAEGRTWPRQIHKLVLSAFRGPRPEGMLARHLNGNHTDNRIANLAWGTAFENAEDAKAHKTGRYPGRRYFSDAEIVMIRRKYASAPELQVSLYTLAKEYKVSIMTISHIVNRRSYRHVADAEWQALEDVVVELKARTQAA